MFDWARGFVLKRMIQLDLIGMHDNQLDKIWLKNWSKPWMFAAFGIPADARVLDVGSSYPWDLERMREEIGIEAHVLEQGSTPDIPEQFGVTTEIMEQFPKVTFHLGLAGQDIVEPDYFDFITCISVMEHTYDREYAVDPQNPLAHVNVLRDLIRMLKPGGILMLNYDIFLHGVPTQLGWDYLADITLLRQCGVPLLTNRRILRDRIYIYNHPDSLFMAPEAIMPMLPMFVRSTSITMVFRKPGGESQVKLDVHPELQASFFPPSETISDPQEPAEEAISSAEIEGRFRSYIVRLQQSLGV